MQVRGIPAHIVLPRNTPKCKVEAVKASGGLCVEGYIFSECLMVMLV